MLFNKFLPKVSEIFQKKAQISFYLWSLALVVVSGRTVEFIISQDKSNYTNRNFTSHILLFRLCFTILVRQKNW
jgi:BASS family bile acid:Na+ symporter